MQDIKQKASFYELFPEFNQLLHTYGYSPVREIKDLNWEQWLELRYMLFQIGNYLEADLAKKIGFDLNAGFLN